MTKKCDALYDEGICNSNDNNNADKVSVEAAENPQRGPKTRRARRGSGPTESGQALQDSVSAVSKPIFGTKYSFKSRN